MGTKLTDFKPLQEQNKKLKEINNDLLEALECSRKELDHLMDWSVEQGIIDLDDETDGLKDYRKCVAKINSAIAKAKGNE